MTAQEQKSTYTFEEYLELEKNTGKRWEYYFGEVFAMAGGSKRHNRLVGKMRRILEDKTEPKNCQVFSENIKLELSSAKQYVYPDVMLTCHPQDLEDETESIIRHPSIVVEVLSETTEAYDQGGKKLSYFRLESLLYYVLVWQATTTVEVFEKQVGSRNDSSRNDGSQNDSSRSNSSWSYRNYSSKEEQIEFPLLDFSILVGDLYQ